MLLLLSQARPIGMLAVGVAALIYVYLTRPAISGWFWALAVAGVAATAAGAVVTGEFWMVNNLASLYIIGGVLLLWFSIPITQLPLRHSLFQWTMGCFTVGLLIHDVLGIAQWVLTSTDDRFRGLYGSHGLGVHGLMLLNSIATLYYLVLSSRQPTKRHVALLILFATSTVLAGFGTGIMCLTATLFVGLLLIRNWRLTAHTAALALYCLSVQVAFDSFNTGYYGANLERMGRVEKWNKDEVPIDTDIKATGSSGFQLGSPPTVREVRLRLKAAERLSAFPMQRLYEMELPRKYVALHTYAMLVLREPHFLLGTGPGTYSSRVSFMLNGDYNENPVVTQLGPQLPTLASRYVYPLWWKQGILKRPYADGTRNQPFSQVMALVAEYGLVFALMLLGAIWCWGRRYFQDLQLAGRGRASVPFEFSVLLLVFTACLLAVDNMMEHAEFLVILMLVKTLHTDGVAARTVTETAEEQTDADDDSTPKVNIAAEKGVHRMPERVLEAA